MDLPVTLIVKAPNQQIEDQTVQCELSWSINKLKQHLSEVHPSKPPKHEQKLIYSGQLLGDTVILKDILRQYEGQHTHTVHLVCSMKYNAPKAKLQQAETMASNANSSATSTSSNAPSSSDQRVPNMQWYNQINTPDLSHTATSSMDTQMMHFMMMQQAMMQAYYTQYQYMQQNYRNERQSTTEVPPAADAPGVEAAQQPPPGNNAQNIGGENRDMHRDWLDMFYILTRTMIFISIVYFYSSALRCLVVIALALCLYLYQIGFFRNVNTIHNNDIVDGQSADEPPAPTRLMVMWTFFSSFFVSLLPEIPNVAA